MDQPETPRGVSPTVDPASPTSAPVAAAPPIESAPSAAPSTALATAAPAPNTSSQGGTVVPKWVLLPAIAAAGPMALVVDTVVRRILFTRQPEDVQQFLAENLTHFAWFIVPLPTIGGLIGLFRYAPIYFKSLDPTQPNADAKADMKALFLATTFAQAPALFGDISLVLGAGYPPALVCTSTSVLWVFLIGFFGRRMVLSKLKEAGEQPL